MENVASEQEGPRDPVGGRTGLSRLLTPGLLWLVVGLSALLGAIVVLGVQDPRPPSLSMGALDLLGSLGLWGGCLLVAAAGLGSAGHGMLLLASYDRDEALTSDEAPEPRPSVAERTVGRGGLGLMLVSVAALLGLGLLADPGADGTPLVIWAAAGILGGTGLIAAGLAYLGLRAPGPTEQERRRWQQTRDAGLRRPLRHLHLGILILLTLTAVGLQLTLIRWVVEDAAISFAYARNLAWGEGLVTYPGGERVEGYSNPLWTFLLAAWYLVGVDGFTSNKIMAAVFAALTVPLTWGIAREARPHRADLSAILAAAVLTFSAQFIIWGAGGLENSLLNVLIAAAVWRALVEARRGGVPLSALFWLGVAVTRPDGILYAAIGGFWSMIFRITRVGSELADGAQEPARLPAILWRALWPTLAWLALFFVPFGLYQAWRVDYFAWELPNTYYAKKGNPSKAFEPFSWNTKGWKYLRQWAHHLAHGYLLPVYIVGVLGRRGVRGAIAVFCLALCAVVLLIPGPEVLKDALGWDPALPEFWVHLRVWTVFLVAVLAPFAAIGRPGWKGLVLLSHVATAALFFAVYAGGDWMNGFRWMATFTVPGAVLLAVGLAELGDACRKIDRVNAAFGIAVGAVAVLAVLPFAIGLWVPPSSDTLLFGNVGARGATPGTLLGVLGLIVIGVVGGLLGQRTRPDAVRWGPLAWVVVIALFGTAVVPSVTRLDRFLDKPTTSPWSVRRRVQYMNYVQARLHMVERPTNMDVDMGAHMYWSGDRIVDIAGLVDVSMGHHWFDRPFIAEYIFEERRPHFAHVHGGWASTSKLKTYDQWDEQYIEIAPYPTGKTAQHTGNHVRRDLIAPTDWDPPGGREVVFAGGLVLHGWDVPAGRVAPGRHMYVEIGWRVEKDVRRGEGFRPLIFLANERGVAHSWDAAPGYDWYLPQDWELSEVVVTRLSLELPDDLPEGRYDFGVFVHDLPKGDALPALEADFQPGGVLAAGAVLEPVRMGRGEVRWPDAVEVVSTDAITREGEQEVAEILRLAGSDGCDEAEDLWLLARRRQTRTLFDERNDDRVDPALADCWATRADGLTEREARVAAFQRAGDWNHRSPVLARLRQPHVDALMAEGERLREAQSWPEAYAAFRDVLRMDPSRSWARRYAIEARDCKLRIRLDEHDCGVLPPDQPATPPVRRPLEPGRTPARLMPRPRIQPGDRPPPVKLDLAGPDDDEDDDDVDGEGGE